MFQHSGGEISRAGFRDSSLFWHLPGEHVELCWLCHRTMWRAKNSPSRPSGAFAASFCCRYKAALSSAGMWDSAESVCPSGLKKPATSVAWTASKPGCVDLCRDMKQQPTVESLNLPPDISHRQTEPPGVLTSVEEASEIRGEPEKRKALPLVTLSHAGSPPTHQDIFSRTDVSQTGTLSLSELRNAVRASGRPRDSSTSVWDPFLLYAMMWIHVGGGDQTCSFTGNRNQLQTVGVNITQGALLPLPPPLMEGEWIIKPETRHSLFLLRSHAWWCKLSRVGLVPVTLHTHSFTEEPLIGLTLENTPWHERRVFSRFFLSSSSCAFLNSADRTNDEWRRAESDGRALRRRVWSDHPGELHRSHPSLWVHEQWAR